MSACIYEFILHASICIYEPRFAIKYGCKYVFKCVHKCVQFTSGTQVYTQTLYMYVFEYASEDMCVNIIYGTI